MSIIFVVIIRSILAFFSLLLLVRLMGKQQIAELTFFDYVVGISIGSIASTLSVQVNQNTTATIVGMIIWTILPIMLSRLTLNNVWIRKVVDGEATIVIQNGKLLENHLKKLRISIDDLLLQLRSQGIFNIEDVEFALFETNGSLSIQKKADTQPVTPKDLNIPTQYDGLPTELILDGKVLIDALRSLHLSKAWLLHQLSTKNIHDFCKVSIAQLDTKGNLYVDLMGEEPSYIIRVNQSKQN